MVPMHIVQLYKYRISSDIREAWYKFKEENKEALEELAWTNIQTLFDKSILRPYPNNSNANLRVNLLIQYAIGDKVVIGYVDREEAFNPLYLIDSDTFPL